MESGSDSGSLGQPDDSLKSHISDEAIKSDRVVLLDSLKTGAHMLDAGDSIKAVTVGDNDPSMPVMQTDSPGPDGEPAGKRWRFETPDGQITYMVLNITEGLDSSDSLNLAFENKFFPETQAVTRVAGESADITQAWLTRRNERDAAAEKGQRWKQGQWSKEEISILQNNINTYCNFQNISDPAEIIFEMSKDERKDFYRIVAKGLQRPLFSVYRRVIRMYDQKNHIGKYTPQETQQLKELKKMYGTDWSAIGTAIGRSAASVKDKSRLIRETCNSGKWTPEEERLLGDAVRELTSTRPGDDVTTGISWPAVAERVGSRSEKQCRTKWLNYLNWKLKGGEEWTKTDDLRLIETLLSKEVKEEAQVDWAALCGEFRSARSPQWLRGKWWNIKKHVVDYSSKSLEDVLRSLKLFYETESVRRQAQSDLNRIRLAKQKERLQAPLSQLEQHLVGANESSSELEIETAEIDGLTYQILPPDTLTQHSARTGGFLGREERTEAVQMPTIELDGQQYIIEPMPGQPYLTVLADQDEPSISYEEPEVTLVHHQEPEVTLVHHKEPEVTLIRQEDEPEVTIYTAPEETTVDSSYLIRDSVGNEAPRVITVRTEPGRISVTRPRDPPANQLLDYSQADQSEALSHAELEVGSQSECLVHEDEETAEYHTAVYAEPAVKVDMAGVLQDHSAAGFPQLSSLSDPMLPADNTDLMTSSDVEDKSTNQDDT